MGQKYSYMDDKTNRTVYQAPKKILLITNKIITTNNNK